MRRSHFILAVALIVIAATMVFVKTFPDEASPVGATSDERARPVTSGKPFSPSERFRSAKSLTPRPASETNFDIGFDQSTLAPLTDDQRHQAFAYAARAENDARATLASLTEKYNLTRQQQRDIFPIVAAHTDSYHPSMAVNGSSVLLPPPGTTLEESIHDELDPDQQTALEEEMLDDIKWWQEIASQLEQELNSATDAGEVAVVTTTEPSAPVTVDTTPAATDGGAASHSGVNIFDLLNQGN